MVTMVTVGGDLQPGTHACTLTQEHRPPTCRCCSATKDEGAWAAMRRGTQVCGKCKPFPFLFLSRFGNFMAMSWFVRGETLDWSFRCNLQGVPACRHIHTHTYPTSAHSSSTTKEKHDATVYPGSCCLTLLRHRGLPSIANKWVWYAVRKTQNTNT
jgi:hypothetical protein